MQYEIKASQSVSDKAMLLNQNVSIPVPNVGGSVRFVCNGVDVQIDKVNNKKFTLLTEYSDGKMFAENVVGVDLLTMRLRAMLYLDRN